MLSKPLNESVRPEITRLPRLTIWRRIFRRLLIGFLRLIVWLFARIETQGLEKIPPHGPLLIVSNHLGDADVVIGFVYAPIPVDALSKAELYDFPILGNVMDAYGIIWVHRGQPDRRALRAAINGLKEGRMVAIAPEGRESLTGALEEGTGGAAYLAYKARAPILPVTFTGTENTNVFSDLKRFRKAEITLTIGDPFFLDQYQNHKQAVAEGTKKIMLRLASQLPEEYQGVYRSDVDSNDISG